MPYLVGAHHINLSCTCQQQVFLGHFPRIPDGELKHLRQAQFWCSNRTLNPVYFNNIVQGHRFSSHHLLLMLLGMLLYILKNIVHSENSYCEPKGTVTMYVIHAANGGLSPWKHDKTSENICKENEWHQCTEKWL